MSTTTTPTAPTADGPRPLWQAPVFVLGMAALAGVWFGRPLFADGPASRVGKDLALVRDELAKSDTDLDHVLKVAHRALDASKSMPDRAAEAGWLVGSVHVRLAEAIEPAKAREAWMRARQYLAGVDGDKLSPEDQTRQIYTLGKVKFHLNEDIPDVINRVKSNLDKIETKAEGYALLTQAYLRLPKPDFAAALEANVAHRDAIAASAEAERYAAMATGGELLLRMGKPDEARATLAKIPETTSPPVLLRARLLRARACQDVSNFKEAIGLYLSALNDPRAAVPGAERGPVFYWLGVCYAKDEQADKAAVALAECQKVGTGDEVPAASLLLADLRRAEPNLEAAFDALQRSVRDINSAREWKNPLVTLAEARAVFERALEACRQNKRHDLAVSLAEPYAKLLAPKDALRVKGTTSAAWAESLGDPSPNGTPAPREKVEQAKEQYAKAANAFAALATQPGLSPAEQGDARWSCVQNYLAGGFQEQAVSQLNVLVTMPGIDKVRLGEAHYRLAEIHRAAGATADAERSFRKCMEFPTRYEYRARYQLAMMLLAEKEPKVDEAKSYLDMNIKMLRWESDPEALTQSLFALSDINYKQRNSAAVVNNLENVLGRSSDAPDAVRAKYQLADSYRQLAAKETLTGLIKDNLSADAKAHYEKLARGLLRKAADEFAALEKLLDTDAAKQQLTLDQITQVPFIRAKCEYNLGAYDKALAVYEKLIVAHAGKVEGLDALGGAVSCHAGMGHADKVRQRLYEIQRLLPTMPADVRGPWESWLAEAKKPLAGP